MNLEKTSLSHCPLCGDNNGCTNSSPNNNTAACWCMESKIPFSDDLLNQLTDAAKNKVCICKACAMGNKAQGTPSN
ncbi:cysteine-rich CWC family protein [uncultured Paraglaciecola sp.]|uniref:cysteine-rich CWC family protein n=1 Tax=uncultured Paraglaciecola sp. TaxID=1765024 RepID=UPI002627545E|nr:cysteine-rich CWC family protein [uncultured Paraglaciecola sp.]